MVRPVGSIAGETDAQSRDEIHRDPVLGQRQEWPAVRRDMDPVHDPGDNVLVTEGDSAIGRGRYCIYSARVQAWRSIHRLYNALPARQQATPDLVCSGESN